MTSVTFDTLRFTNKLKEKGFTAEQAEGVAEAFVDAANDELATKADIVTLRSVMKTDLRDLEIRIIKWLVPLLFGQAALIVALVNLL